MKTPPTGLGSDRQTLLEELRVGIHCLLGNYRSLLGAIEANYYAGFGATAEMRLRQARLEGQHARHKEAVRRIIERSRPLGLAVLATDAFQSAKADMDRMADQIHLELQARVRSAMDSLPPEEQGGES